MSNKKLKQTDNIENFCPTSRKRVKSNPAKNWKVAKVVDSNSSPTVLTNEHLGEMGIGMLDSDESSSSVVSPFALVLSGSADDNSNGVTPNLDAPKMCHQRITSYRTLENTLDSTINSDTNDSTTIITPGRGLMEADCINITDQSNNNNNNNSNAIDPYVENSKQNSQQQSGDKVLLPYRKVAILGMGAGNSTNGSTNPTAIASQPYNTNSNSNSPSAGRSTRSPLTIVSESNNNRACRNTTQHKQQQQNINIGSNGLAINASQTYNTGGSSPNSYMCCMPSTSKQSLLKQQQRQQQQQQQQLLLLHAQVQNKSQSRVSQPTIKPQPPMVLYDNFFLFRQQQLTDHITDGKDYFSTLSDEIVLQIFKWLPKKALIRCGYVSRQFNRCACDESLWTRLDLGGRYLRAGALENILTRGVVILRLAQAELIHPVFNSDFLHAEPPFVSKLQYLDLSMVSVTKPSLKMLLSHCRLLKKLSLEHVPINDEICNEIAKNINLEALNLAMCVGLEAWSLRKIMESLQNLHSLNISWTNLSVDAITSVVTNVTPNLLRINLAGCRRKLYDSHVESLANRCPQLLELDLSDCTAVTDNVINTICSLKMLEYLSISRCYLITASAYLKLSTSPTLTYLDIFGMLSNSSMPLLQYHFPNVGINNFIHSSVARPTVGTRRTSVWGLRTRD